MTIGVLTNCLELCPHAQEAVGGVAVRAGREFRWKSAAGPSGGGGDDADSSGLTLLVVLASALRLLFCPLPPQSTLAPAPADTAGTGDASTAVRRLSQPRRQDTSPRPAPPPCPHARRALPSSEC